MFIESGPENLLFDSRGHWRIESPNKTDIEQRVAQLSYLLKGKAFQLNRKNTAIGLFIPTGYPQTVSEDYLAYQLWTLPTHITVQILFFIQANIQKGMGQQLVGNQQSVARGGGGIKCNYSHGGCCIHKMDY